MGLDYALVHLKYTIPPAILLTLLYKPLFSKLDVYRICFLVTIAVVWTIPWDSNLIRTRIWTYPSDAVLGPTLFQIPLEELFFFVIQTYDVSLLYIILTRPTFHPAYLPHKRASHAHHKIVGILGELFFGLSAIVGFLLVKNGGLGTYMGWIVVWAFPVLLLLWTLSHRLMLRLPRSTVLMPILAPTLYLWIVDTFALRRGTWVIEQGTKYGIHVWEGLDIEEAFFFLVTNMLVVFGQIAFDNAITVMEAFPAWFPNPSRYPSPLAAIKALLLPISAYDSDRIEGYQQAVGRLKRKSRSFYLASSAFSGRLRGDLILLYSFCRVADDLVDGADSVAEARSWISQLEKFLDISYADEVLEKDEQVSDFVKNAFPGDTRQALLQLPTKYLSKQPLYDLLKGFQMDLQFDVTASGEDAWPIQTEHALETYGRRVASTVADLCIELAFQHEKRSTPRVDQLRVREAGVQMGIALQIVNIARDIQVDAKMRRVYIPTDWLKEVDMRPEDVLNNPTGPRVLELRARLLNKAFALYKESRGAIEDLPVLARGPMRVAVDSYMEIGRVLRERDYQVKAGRATVPKMRRLKVAWRALNAR